MSERRIYACDRCKKEAESREEKQALALTTITVGRSIQHSSYDGSRVYAAITPWQGEWCAACCSELGIDKILAGHEVKTQEATAPSLEEMIREIVRQELPR